MTDKAQLEISMMSPIYDCPPVDFAFEIWGFLLDGTRFADIWWAGNWIGMPSETAPGSQVFSNEWMSITIPEPLSDGTSVLGQVSVLFSSPLYGITNVLYPCALDSADIFSAKFENNLHGIVFTKHPLTGKAHLDISTMSFMDDIELTETANGSGVYTDGNHTVEILNIWGKPYLMVTDGMTLSNTLFSVWETAPYSGVYRNYHPAIPTNLDPSDLAMPDFVPWQLKIGGITDAACWSLSCSSS